MMKCPACGNELTHVEAAGVTLDACQGGCGGALPRAVRPPARRAYGRRIRPRRTAAPDWEVDNAGAVVALNDCAHSFRVFVATAQPHPYGLLVGCFTQNINIGCSPGPS